MGPEATIAVAIFDAGNVVMVLGLNNVIASFLIGKQGGKDAVRGAFKLPFSSVPFLACLGMITLSILGGRLPSSLLYMVQLAASANTFLSMIMLGTMISFTFGWQGMRRIGKVLSVHYTLCISMAFVIFKWLPMPPSIRFAMVLSLFAPLSSITPLFVEQLGGNKDEAGLLSSLTIIIAVIAMMALLLLGEGHLAHST